MVLIHISLIGCPRTWLYGPFCGMSLPVLLRGILRAFTDVKAELHKFKLQHLPEQKLAVSDRETALRTFSTTGHEYKIYKIICVPMTGKSCVFGWQPKTGRTFCSVIIKALLIDKKIGKILSDMDQPKTGHEF